MVKALQLLSTFITLLAASVASQDNGGENGQSPGQVVVLNQHNANPLTPLSFMGVYSTNFGETPYCCPWSPKKFEEQDPSQGGWGVVPMVCQVADAGQNGVFNSQGTVLMGQSFIHQNGSLVYYGQAGSRNGAYYFGFASTNNTLKEFDGFFTFQLEKNSSDDGGDLTGPWIWTYVREPSVADCEFALRYTIPSISLYLP